MQAGQRLRADVAGGESPRLGGGTLGFLTPLLLIEFSSRIRALSSGAGWGMQAWGPHACVDTCPPVSLSVSRERGRCAFVVGSGCPSDGYSVTVTGSSIVALWCPLSIRYL